MTAITKPRKEGWETTGVVWNMSSVLREVWPILELEEQGFGIINWDWSYYITQLGHSKYLSSGEGRPSAMAKGKRSHWREASWRKGTENRVQELSWNTMTSNVGQNWGRAHTCGGSCYSLSAIAVLSCVSTTVTLHSPFDLGALLFRYYPEEILTGRKSGLMKC